MANSKWKQIGESIKSDGDRYTSTVSLSNDGNTVAVGSPGGCDSYVCVFRFVKGDWKKFEKHLAEKHLKVLELYHYQITVMFLRCGKLNLYHRANLQI